MTVRSGIALRGSFEKHREGQSHVENLPRFCIVALPWFSLQNHSMAHSVIIASHLVFHGYGHWLGNDPRGSGSTELRDPKFGPLGPIHHGRKRIQPPREELRRFYRSAEPLLNHQTIWFDDDMRQAIARAVESVIKKHSYALWA
jgi:hypothetical protein